MPSINESSSRPEPDVYTKKIHRGRPFLVAAVTALTIALPSAGMKASIPIYLDNSPSYSWSINSEFTTETHPFPPNYSHDFILPPTDEFAAKDGGASVELSKGVYLVTYSDTLQGKIRPGLDGKQSILTGTENLINNSAVIFDENKQEYTLLKGAADRSGNDTAWIKPLENDGSYYWIQTPVVENGKLYIYLDRNIPNENNIFGKHVGTDIAIFDLKDGKPTGRPEIIKLPESDSQTEIIKWGASILQDKQKEFTYIYGSTEQLGKDNPYHVKELRVARVPYGHMAEINKWQFYDGKDWTDDEKKAKTIINKNQGVSSGFSTHLIDGKVVLTSKDTDILQKGVNFFIGDSPVGPFKKRTAVESLDKYIPKNYKSDGTMWTYLAYLHPEINGPEGKILITFSIMPESQNPGEIMKKNILTYSLISVWVDKNQLMDDLK